MKKASRFLTLTLMALMLAAPAAYANKAAGSDGKHAKKTFEDCDKDKDNALNAEEFSACFPRVGKHFAEIDADKDGKVTKDELKAFRAERKAAKAAAGEHPAKAKHPAK